MSCCSDSTDRTILILGADREEAARFEEELDPTNASTRLLSDPDDGLDFLHRRGEYADAERPDIVLLDLDLPRERGFELLSEIKSTPGMKRTPVIVLTSATSEATIARTYEHQANALVPKPNDEEELTAIFGAVERFWLSTAQLPRK